MNKDIKYPYLPEGRTILYVPADNQYILEAKKTSREQSLDKVMPTGSVVVRDGRTIGRSGNGSDFHEKNVCERVKQGIPTGQGCDLCEGCHPNNHSEPRAIKNALENGHDTNGADLYLWGHWWCCEPCWKSMIEAGIKNVYLLEGSEKMFDKNHPENVVRRQFD